MAGSRTKNPVESRRGFIPLSQIPLRPVVATSRPGEYRGGRIPYKKNRSVPWLPDPVQTKYFSPVVAPLNSRGNFIPRDSVPRSKTRPGEGPEKFGLLIAHFFNLARKKS